MKLASRTRQLMIVGWAPLVVFGPHGKAQLDAMNSFLAPFVTDKNSRVFNRRTGGVTDPEPNPAAGQ